MGAKQRNKGYRGEHEIRKLLKEEFRAWAGYDVVWNAEDSDRPDLTIETPTNRIKGEVKYRAIIPRYLYQWLNEKDTDILFVRRVSKKDKNNPWLVVMEFDKFKDYLI